MANEIPNENLLFDIINNHLSVDDVKMRIREIEAEYGTDYFLDYDIEKAEIERKPKQDWNEEYYEQIKTPGILGVTSKQYFLYFAEVNEYIYNKRLEEKKSKQRKKTTAIIAAIVALILCIVILILYFNGSTTYAAGTFDYQQTAISAYAVQAIVLDL